MENIEIRLTCDCGCFMPLGVFMSAAGYFIGYWCNNCGPFDRISGYYKTRKDAENDLYYFSQLEKEYIVRQNTVNF